MSVTAEEPKAEADDRAKTTAVAVVKQDDRPPPKSQSALAKANKTDELPLADAAKLLMASGLVKSNEDIGKILTKISFGRSLGLSDVASINGIGLTPNGTLILSAALMLSLIKRSGKYRIVYKQRTDKVCEIEVYERVDGQWMTCGASCSFSWDDAVRAKLATKPTYTQFPKQMLTARCIADVFRTHCADCSGVAVYTPEEIPEANFRTDPETLEMVPDAEYESKSKPAARKATASPAAGALDRVLKLIADTKTDTDKFLAYFKKTRVEDLTEKELLSAEDLLKKKARATP